MFNNIYLRTCAPALPTNAHAVYEATYNRRFASPQLGQVSMLLPSVSSNVLHGINQALQNGLNVGELGNPAYVASLAGCDAVDVGAQYYQAPPDTVASQSDWTCSYDGSDTVGADMDADAQIADEDESTDITYQGYSMDTIIERLNCVLDGLTVTNPYTKDADEPERVDEFSELSGTGVNFEKVEEMLIKNSPDPNNFLTEKKVDAVLRALQANVVDYVVDDSLWH